MEMVNAATLDNEQLHEVKEALFDVCDRDPYIVANVLLMIYVELCQKYRSDKPSRQAIADAAHSTIMSMEWFDHGTQN